jgi:Domain of unknown function (DUF4349)
MPTRDPIAPGRLEELLGGAIPEGEREALVQGLVRELRAEAPVARPLLRERVRNLVDQPARRRPALPRRRTALALAFVLVAVAGVSSAVVLSGGDEPGADAGAGAAAPTVTQAGATDAESGDDAAPAPERASPGFLLQPMAKDARLNYSERTLLQEPLPTRGRATDVALWMELRLPGAEELSAAAVEAMAVTRDLGGRVAASDVETEGNEGRAELALGVPVARVEDAVVRLGELGTVTGERVETIDLQRGIDRRNDRIEQLERAIRVLQLRLESGTLTPEEELRVRLQIERHENAIEDLRHAIRADRREAATSELALVLHTREAAAKQEEDESGAVGAAREALEFLAAAGTIALFLVIILSPVVLLLVLLWLAFRARSRRIETRLLDRPGPAAPPSG